MYKLLLTMKSKDSKYLVSLYTPTKQSLSRSIIATVPPFMTRLQLLRKLLLLKLNNKLPMMALFSERSPIKANLKFK